MAKAKQKKSETEPAEPKAAESNARILPEELSALPELISYALREGGHWPGSILKIIAEIVATETIGIINENRRSYIRGDNTDWTLGRVEIAQMGLEAALHGYLTPTQQIALDAIEKAWISLETNCSSGWASDVHV